MRRDTHLESFQFRWRACGNIVAQFKVPRGSALSRAAAAVVSGSIRIPPHLLLPPFDLRCQINFTTNDER